MGLLDELKKLTKPYNDADYLEEDLTDPVRVPYGAEAVGNYGPYASNAPQARRPYVFSGQPRSTQTQPSGYAPRQAGYPQQNPYAQQAYAQPQSYGQPGYAQPNPYAQQAYPQQPYTPARSAGQPRLLLVKPDRFEVAADIADKLNEKNAVVLNLENTDREIARRLLDFLSGVTYALNGKIKKASGSTYVITPDGMDFTGDDAEDADTKQ